MKKFSLKLVSTLLTLLTLSSMFSMIPVSAAEADTKTSSTCATGEIPVDNFDDLPDLKVVSSLDDYNTIVRGNSTSTYKSLIKANQLKSSVDNSTSKYFPEIGSQGDIGSCVSWSSTYYQFTYEMNRKLKKATTDKNTFNPLWVHNKITSGYERGSGAYPSDPYKLLKSQGDVTFADLAYDDTIRNWYPSENLWTKSLDYRLSGYTYYELPGNETAITSPTDSDLTTIKTALSDGYILTYSTDISGDRDDPNDGWQYSEIEKSSTCAGQKIVTHVIDGGSSHRMTLVGYNDNIWVDLNNNNKAESAEKGAFKVANSWGTKYGNSGFMWVSYDALNKKSAVTKGPKDDNRSPAINDIIGIEVADYNSDANINLVYNVNSIRRNQVDITVTATPKNGGKALTGKVSPYRDSDFAISKHNTFSFYGTEKSKDATMVFALDNVVPGLTSETFYDYDWSVKVSDSSKDKNALSVKKLYIIDKNTNKTYSSNQTLPKSVNGTNFTAGFFAASLTSSKTSGINPYENLTFTAKATGGKAPYQYKFSYTKDGNTTNGSYSTSSTYKLQPPTAGTYKVAVTVKDSAGKTVSENYSFTCNQTKITNLTPNYSTVAIGRKVKFTPTVTNASSVIKATNYVYTVTKNGKTTTLTTASDKTSTWNPTEAGTYTVKLAIKYNGKELATKSISYVVNKTLSVNLTSSKTTNIYPYDSLTLTATPTGGVAPYKYKFTYTYNGTTTTIKDFSDTSTCSFQPTASGTYTIKATVKDSFNTQTTKQINVTCNSSSISKINLSNSAPLTGETVTLSASTANISSAITASDYVYTVTLNGKTTTLTTASNKKASWTPKQAGNYTIKLSIKHSGKTLATQSISCIVVDKLTTTLTASKTSGVCPYDTVTFTANANGGSNPLTYKFTCTKSGTTTVLRDYTSDHTYKFQPTAAGTYKITVTAKDYMDRTATASYTMICNQTSITKLTASTSSVVAGKSVKFTPTVTNVSSVIKASNYVYTVTKGSKTTTLTTASDKTATWTPTEAGTYTVKLTIKHNGTTLASKSMSYVVKAPALSTTLTSSKPASIGRYEVLTLTAKATGGTAPYQYKFTYTTNGKTYTFRDYTSSASCDMQITAAGTYKLTATVKDSTGKTATASCNVTCNQPTISKLTASKSSATVKESVKFTPTVTNVASVIKASNYVYTVTKSGKTTTLTTASDKTATWTPTEAGTYTVKLTIKHNGTTLASKSMSYVVKAPALSTTLTSSKPASIGRYEVLTLTAKATGGTAPYQYKFTYTTNGKTYTFRDYTSSASCDMQITAAGTYKLTATVKDSTGKTATASCNVTCNQPTISKLTASKSSATVKESVKFTPTVTNVASVIKASNYVYTVTKSGKTTTLTTASDKTATWTPTEAGTYTVKLAIKYNGKELAAKTMSYTVKAPAITATVTSSKTIGIGLYEKVTLTAKATGSTSYQYKFAYTRYGQTVTIRDFSTSPTCTFQMSEMGPYGIILTVKDSKGNTATANLNLNCNQTYIMELNANPTKGTVGKSVKFSAVTQNEADLMTASNYVYAVTKGSSTKKLTASSDKTATWTPTEAGTYTVTLKLVYNNATLFTKIIDYVVEKATENELTIYYKGYSTPYIHYQVGTGSWTTAPGKAMTKTSEATGYTHKYTIKLGTSTYANVCFNDGKGNWDSKNGANYKFNAGTYTYSNGTINKYIVDTSMKIQSFTISPSSTTIKPNEVVKMNVALANAPSTACVRYSYLDPNGKEIVIQDYISSYTAQKQFTTEGTYTLIVRAKESFTATKYVEARKTITVKNQTANTLTIYYKGYSTPYIHYQVGTGSWTAVPGKAMTATSEKSGYTHKYTINLGTATYANVCFNDGKGNWDSKNGANYKFNSGTYTYSGGKLTKIA